VVAVAAARTTATMEAMLSSIVVFRINVQRVDRRGIWGSGVR
jgi:hypothetical protein